MSGLGKLRTLQGERSTYDAVSQCSRCGYCEQACPTYVVSGKESFNPRGRNQLVRLMLEGKLQDPASAAEALSTCLLCGACSTACYAHIPTPDIVLEGRRRLQGGSIPWLVRVLRWLMEDRPALFRKLLKLGYGLKRAGIPRLFGALGIFKLLGLGALAAAERQVDELPHRFASETLGRDLGPRRGGAWSYFAACGTEYLFPRVAAATVRVLEASLGPGSIPGNPCCGLLFYNYGDLEAARRLARRNIEGASGDSPVVADCSSCVAHLKSYPQLFLDDPEWKKRAEAFSGKVKDIIELLPDIPPQTSLGRVTYHDSCRACHGQGLAEPGRRWMKAVFPGYADLPEAGFCCGGAGAFAFVHPELSDDVLRRKVSCVARIQASLVATSSTSCLLQLAHGLKKYYPECKVVHVVELAAEGV